MNWPWKIKATDKAMTVVMVSLEDLCWARKVKWHINTTGYAFMHKDGSSVLLHRAIMQMQPGDERVVDHINGNKHDNRRDNLRAITTAENNQNVKSRGGSSESRGVHFSKSKKKWVASGHRVVDGKSKTVHIGYFESEDEASSAASTWRKEHLLASNEDRHQ